MPYAGYELQDIPVLLDAKTEGVAAISHDPYGKLDITVRHRDPVRGMEALFGGSHTTLISSTAAASIRVEIGRAVSRQVTIAEDCTQEFGAAEALVSNANAASYERPRCSDYFLSGIRSREQAFDFTAGGVQWRLSMLDDYLRTDFTRQDEVEPVTAVLSSEQNELPEEEVDAVAARIETMLSFAAGGLVTMVRIDRKHEGETVATHLRDRRKVPPFVFPPLLYDSATPGVLKHFIESAYESYTAASKWLPLRRFVHGLVYARSQGVIDIAALTAVNLLEVVRYNYAANVLVPAGVAKSSGRNEFESIKAAKRMTFREIMEAFLKEYRISAWDRKFKVMRDAVFHGEEVGGATVLEQHAAVMDLVHFSDVVVLTLCGWDESGGKYVPCNDPHMVRRTTDGKTAGYSYGVNLKSFVR